MDNYRSDSQILNFVNFVMQDAMTVDFGGDNYKANSMLQGPNVYEDNFAPVIIDVVNSSKETQQQEDNLDILRQIQQMKQDAPSSDDEEDEALIEKIKQLLDEFN